MEKQLKESMIKIFKLILISMLFLTCKNQVKVYYDSSGSMIREFYNSKEGLQYKLKIINDSMILKQVFFKDGELQDSFLLINMKMEGRRHYVNKKSKRVFYTEYKAGEKNGKEKCYYFNGNKRYNGYYQDDKKIGEWKFYYKNGNLNVYEFYDNPNSLRFQRKYDNNGNIISTIGNSIAYIAVDNDTVLKPFENCGVTIKMVNPPNSYSILKVGTLNEEGIIENLHQLDVENNKAFYIQKFRKPKKYKKVYINTLVDSIANEVFTSKSMILFRVTNKK